MHGYIQFNNVHMYEQVDSVRRWPQSGMLVGPRGEEALVKAWAPLKSEKIKQLVGLCLKVTNFRL